MNSVINVEVRENWPPRKEAAEKVKERIAERCGPLKVSVDLIEQKEIAHLVGPLKGDSNPVLLAHHSGDICKILEKLAEKDDCENRSQNTAKVQGDPL